MNNYPIATILGGGGFIGRYLVKSLANKHYRCIIPTRKAFQKGYLKTQAPPGSVELIDFNSNNFDKIEEVTQIIGDFTKDEYKEKLKSFFNKKVDVVISDMAVNTTGNKNLDAIVTGELCIEAMNFAYEQIDKKGKFVSKIFMGSSLNEIVADAKKKFKEVNIYKPLSSRKDSKESFIICKFLR